MLFCVIRTSESDIHETYANRLISLFTAEGLVSGHNFLYCATEKLDNLFSTLPDVAASSDSTIPASDEFKIAWRYQALRDLEVCFLSCFCIMQPIFSQQINPSSLSPGHYFDLSKLMDTDARTKEHDLLVTHFAPQPASSVALITLPRSEPGLTSRLRHYADYVFSLKGFDGIESRNPLYEEYDGLMTAIQLPWLGSNLEPTARPATLEWAFKLKRRQFVLQHLHLPPCLSNTVSRSSATETILCSKTPGTDISAIDF
ncbi:elongator complex protein 4 [Paragonimus westermani]|uniref:Elongator complex protein 4 n=1 Tax=Paragonimus westermani TaxID=34504 RepID=A0A5J4NEW2_9TREM|nr:elongator complex protein 4 [Paragonimus westermani]